MEQRIKNNDPLNNMEHSQPHHEQLDELRAYMDEHGGPKTDFKGAPLPEVQNEPRAEIRELTNEELEDDSIADDLRHEAFMASLEQHDPLEVFNGLNEVDRDHYKWLEKMIPIVGGSIDDIMEEVHAIDAKWPNIDIGDLESGQNFPREEFGQLLEDEGQKFELMASVHELKKELNLFKRERSKLSKKMGAYRAEKIRGTRIATNKDVRRKIDEIETNEMDKWFDDEKPIQEKNLEPKVENKPEIELTDDEREIQRLRQKYEKARKMKATSTPETVESG